MRNAVIATISGGGQTSSKLTTRKIGFTLAEVLITLGIIGVVAAMTLPALSANYKRQEYSARIKKFYSSFTQAIQRSEVDNGSALYWTKLGQIQNEEGNFDSAANAKYNAELMKKYILPYMKYVSLDENRTYTKVILADGSQFTLHNGACIDVMYDMNGDKQPNMDGFDVFRLLMCFDEGTRLSTWQNKNRFVGPYGHYSSREIALRECKVRPITCSALLEMDGWEFKKDYPNKLW